MGKRSRLANLACAALIVFGFDCNAIVGNSAHELASDAATPASDAGDAATVGGGCSTDQTACGPDHSILQCSGSGQWEQGVTCPYVCSGGACAGSCVPGATQCNGNTPQTCDPSGTWQSGTACPKVCSAGACAGSCVPGATQCSNKTPQTCDSTGTWQSATDCPYVCQAGSCTGVCTPNDTQCMNDTPQTCDATGQWQSGKDCANVCTAGACTGQCVPGTMQPCGDVSTCNAGGTETCDPTGNWGVCSLPVGNCAAVPSGWSPVSFAPSGCASGFANPQSVVTSASASPFACSCMLGHPDLLGDRDAECVRQLHVFWNSGFDGRHQLHRRMRRVWRHLQRYDGRWVHPQQRELRPVSHVRRHPNGHQQARSDRGRRHGLPADPCMSVRSLFDGLGSKRGCASNKPA